MSGLGWGEGVVAPFVPSPPRALRWLRQNIARLLGMQSTVGQPVFYEAGCGEGIVSRLVADITKSYCICLEINADRLEDARRLTKRAGLDYLVDFVQGDLTGFYLRRSDIVYAYLFPNAMEPLYDALPPGALLISLDFSVPGITPIEYHELGAHGVYIYRVGGNRATRRVLLTA